MADLASPQTNGASTPKATAALPAEHKPLLHNVAFFDIDGSLVHYPQTLEKWGDITGPSVLPGCFMYVDKESGKRHKLLKLPPTTTGVQGVISVQTLTALAKLREAGVRLVLITGARMSTLLQRLPFLPAADAFVCENGGRIFYSNSSLPTALPWAEDMDWRKLLNSTAGPPDSEVTPPEKRNGKLWEFYREVTSQGWPVDCHSYTTNFRIKVRDPHSQDDLEKLLQTVPEELATSFNLGLADVYPAISGKHNAAKHLLEVFKASADSAVLMADDDNDLGLAELVGKVFVPSITSESMRHATEADTKKFMVSDKGGVIGTETLLQHISDHFGGYIMG